MQTFKLSSKPSSKSKINDDPKFNSLSYGINLVDGGISFLLEGKPNQTVHWVGDFNDWSLSDPVEYDSELKAYHFFMPASDFGIYFYKWVVNGKWILDPHNALHYTNRTMGTNSMVKMPAYHEPFEVFSENSSVISKLELYNVESKALKGSRSVHLYLPEAYFSDNVQMFPLLVLQDGSECVDLLPAKKLFDQLISSNLVKPFVCLLVSPQTGQRDQDYIFNKNFEYFLAKELLDWTKKQGIRLLDDSSKRAILGYSLGGLVSVRTAIHYPEAYGLAGGESSAFWPENFRIFDEVMELKPLKTQFHLGCGNLDGGQQMTALMSSMLTRLGIQYQSRISIGGHDWYYWKTHMRNSLQYFFPI